MKEVISREEQINRIDLERNVLFAQKDVIDKQLIKLHKRKEKIMEELDSEFIKKIPGNVEKISKEQWAWILDCEDQKHSMLQYDLRSKILNGYGLYSFGSYTETKHPCFTFHEGFNPVKAKQIMKILVKHIKPIDVKGTHPEHGVPINFTGLVDDTTSVSYIHDDGSAIIYISSNYDSKKFDNFDLLIDYVANRLKIKKNYEDDEYNNDDDDS